MSDSTENPKAEFHTDMPVGEILRRGREHFGQSLEDVERNLRIRAIQLHALETGNIDQLPGKAYALGFVRSYSEYLGLDGEKMVQLFKRQSLGVKIQPNLNFPTPASESKLPGVFVAAGFAIVGILAIWGWVAYSSDDRSAVDVVPVVNESSLESIPPATTQVSNAPAQSLPQNASLPADQIASEEQTVSTNPDAVVAENPALNAENASGIEPSASDTALPVSAETPEGVAESAAQLEGATTTAVPENAAAPVTDQEKGIIINVKENSWVEIRDTSGKALVSRVLKAGDQYFVPDRPDLRMSLGNASGVEIVIDGVALPNLGARGEVKRNISLDSRSLKALAAR